MAKPFILNDESVKNSHGFFLLNSGGHFDRFDSNPVMLDNHNMDRLCGKWLNRRIEGQQLIADPDFDTGCSIGAERQGQAERGYLNGASLGIQILKAQIIGDDLFVTEWDVFEASVTPIPSNAGCVQLKIYDLSGNVIEDNKVRAHVECIVQLCAQSDKNENKTLKIPMEKITLSAQALTVLGLDASAPESALSASIVALAAERDKYKNLHEAQIKKSAEELVDLAIKDGKITADKKDAFVKLALADFDTTKTTLDGISTKQTLSGVIKSNTQQSAIPTERKGWTCLQWLKNDPAEYHRIKSEDPEAHASILANSK